ncbi:MAG: L,D-transpeptidase family protein [Steroidobacteraceae bacterium]
MNAHNLLRSAALLPIVLLAGCQLLQRQPEAPPPAVVEPPPPIVYAPAATQRFQFDPATTEVVGQLQLTKVGQEDTVSDIARRFNLGYEEVLRANPGVDPWLPGVGRELVLPTRFVLPDAPYEGLVVNLAALRVYYFPKRKEGELQTVYTFPIGIGKVGWQTPEGVTKIVSKRRDPIWTVPASVRAEHKKNNDPLPAKVGPGPDNPLGAFAMNLGWPSYLVHGTNKPYGVGMRSSHGCVRLYPEDIAPLFQMMSVGTKVTVVNQPIAFGWEGDALHMQIFPILEDDPRQQGDGAQKLLDEALTVHLEKRLKQHGVAADLDLIKSIAVAPRGITVPISRQGTTVDAVLASTRRVENVLPAGATWDGKKELRVTAAEFEALLADAPEAVKPTPAKPAAKPATKPASTTPAPKAGGTTS